MRAWRMTLLTLLIAALMALALSSPALAGKHKAFIELSTGDLTDFEIWEDSHFSPTGDLYYNRVDGLLLYMGMKYRSETQLHPRLKAMWGWPSARSGSYYQLDIEQPIHSQDSFSFGVSLCNKSAWSLEDAESISDFGNNLQAFFARLDGRDYFRQDGVTVFAQHKLTPELTLRGEFRSHDLESISEQQSVWTPFRNDEEWRENPPLMVGILKGAREFEGRMQSYVLSAEYNSRDEDARTGWRARGLSEYGGRSAGGDYEFRKHSFEGSMVFPITETQTLDLFGMWGISDGTDFPSHKLFHLGGRGNLRGYDYKEFSGKNILFGRAEYKVQMTEPLEMVYFLESGQVDYTTSTPESDGSDGYKHDAGIGFRFEAPWDGWWGLDVAKAMEEESDIQVYLRLLLIH